MKKRIPAFLTLRTVCLLIPILSISFNANAQQTFVPNAHWIRPGFSEDSINRPCPIFRRTFTLRQAPSVVKLKITSHGLYEVALNGGRIGTDWFTPGFTSYHHRLQYQEYVVTNQTHASINQLIVTVGDGWWRGRYGADLQNNRYGKDAGLLAQLEITYEDGSRETIVTDSNWQCTMGPIRYADLYSGEVQDTRVEPGPWGNVIAGEGPGDNLIPASSAPIREHEVFHPMRILTTSKGERVVDFGQNLAGWVRFTVDGKPGDTVQLQHAEALDSLGNFYTGNLRLAKAEDVYILHGGHQTLSPHFTYHGFRYVKVVGYPGPLRPEDLTAIALYSDLPQAGQFSCSDPLINQLQRNITWSQKSNFMDIPTDCPQRSERFGWAGDVQIFSRTASFNQDVKAFFLKWLGDLAAEQGTNGGLPVYIPDYRFPDTVGPRGGVAGWGDAATILPWTLYKVYGDNSILRRQYSSMKAWVEYIHKKSAANGGLWNANGYGDWYAPLGPTDIGYIDECFFAHSVDILARTADVLGNTEEAANYSRLLQHVKALFLSTYFHRDSLPATQTAYVLALQFDLLPDSSRARAADRLATMIHQNNDHLATGFLGTPYLLWVLSRYGHADLAFTLLKQTTVTSWLYPLTKGATTIWEKWDGIRPDGGFDTCSLNHYAYGAVGDWLYRYVAGIDAAEPGYRKIRIQPHVGGGLTWVNASYTCPYGTIVSNWKVKGKRLIMKVVIPRGTTATIQFPGRGASTNREVGPGNYSWRVSMAE